MIIGTITLFVFGNQLYLWVTNKFTVLKDLALLIISLRTLVGLVVLIVFFLIIYIVIPNRKTRLYNQLPGAIVSAEDGWAFPMPSLSTLIISQTIPPCTEALQL